MREFATLPFRPSARPGWYGPVGYLLTVVGVATATGLMRLLLPIVSDASIYLVYLVVVVAVSVGWGLKQGVLASVLGFLAANFFFTEPLFSFTVNAVQDVVALITFLGLATLTSQLVAHLRREAEDARRNQRTTATLYSLSQILTGQYSLPRMLDEVAAQLSDVLDLEACTITLADTDDRRPTKGEGRPKPNTEHPTPNSQHQEQSDHQLNASSVMVTVPLSAGERSLGVLRIVLPPDRRSLNRREERMVAAFVEQLQAAIERAQLQQTAVETEVLRRTDALRAALLSALAHDLRTPLSSIKSAATSLLSPRVQWSREDQQDFLNAIVAEVDHINRIAGNLLDMSRIEAGRMQPHKEPHQIKEVIDTVVERLGPRLSDHPVSVHVELGLPPVPIDAVQIDEVLTNLLENAVKYTPAGTPIEIRACRQACPAGSSGAEATDAGDAIELQVADRGPGIPREDMPHLFSRFYRVTAGSSAKVPGTGLGLAIVKGIVEAHGGQVSAANAPGGGAVFGFTLPIRTKDEGRPTTGN